MHSALLQNLHIQKFIASLPVDDMAQVWESIHTCKGTPTEPHSWLVVHPGVWQQHYSALCLCHICCSAKQPLAHHTQGLPGVCSLPLSGPPTKIHFVLGAVLLLWPQTKFDESQSKNDLCKWNSGIETRYSNALIENCKLIYGPNSCAIQDLTAFYIFFHLTLEVLIYLTLFTLTW